MCTIEQKLSVVNVATNYTPYCLDCVPDMDGTIRKPTQGEVEGVRLALKMIRVTPEELEKKNSNIRFPDPEKEGGFSFVGFPGACRPREEFLALVREILREKEGKE